MVKSRISAGDSSGPSETMGFSIMEQSPDDPLFEVTLEIKHLADTFERFATALKMKTTVNGSQDPPGNQSYQEVKHP